MLLSDGYCEYGNEHLDYMKVEENPLPDVQLGALRESDFSIELVAIVN
jgi:hypothetical protein